MKLDADRERDPISRGFRFNSLISSVCFHREITLWSFCNASLLLLSSLSVGLPLERSVLVCPLLTALQDGEASGPMTSRFHLKVLRCVGIGRAGFTHGRLGRSCRNRAKRSLRSMLSRRLVLRSRG